MRNLILSLLALMPYLVHADRWSYYVKKNMLTVQDFKEYIIVGKPGYKSDTLMISAHGLEKRSPGKPNPGSASIHYYSKSGNSVGDEGISEYYFGSSEKGIVESIGPDGRFADMYLQNYRDDWDPDKIFSIYDQERRDERTYNSLVESLQLTTIAEREKGNMEQVKLYLEQKKAASRSGDILLVKPKKMVSLKKVLERHSGQYAHVDVIACRSKFSTKAQEKIAASTFRLFSEVVDFFKKKRQVNLFHSNCPR